MVFKRKKKKADEQSVQEQKRKHTIRESGFYSAIKPKNKYYFFSDYFVIDDGAKYGSVLTVIADEGAEVGLSPFWGVLLALVDLGSEYDDISVRFISKSRLRDKSWVESHIDATDRVVSSNENESADFSKGDVANVGDSRASLDETMESIRHGASYLDVRMKYLVKAPSLERLDAGIRRINRVLRDRFDTVRVEAYNGSQRHELSMLLRSTTMITDRQFGFTSDEYAGFYNLVTNGIDDLDGEYIGNMQGDVNQAAIMFNVNRYKSHVVIASGKKASLLGHPLHDISPSGTLMGADMWGIKLGQKALQNNQRVVHLVMNDTRIKEVGLDLSSLTSEVDMNHGALNMFEVFGRKREELTLMNPLIRKITMMAKLVAGLDLGPNPSFDINLQRELTQFFIDEKMWVYNPEDPVNRESVKLVGLPHNEYPLLDKFNLYFRKLYDKLAKGGTNEQQRIAAVEALQGTFEGMLQTASDLFNVYTDESIDDANRDSRVIYNFSELRSRGEGIAMAQLVNVLGYAVNSLREGDVVVIHGVEQIKKELKPYIAKDLKILMRKGVRVVYTYGDIDDMLSDVDFNHLDTADYSLIGNMSQNEVERYDEVLGTSVPGQLQKSITQDVYDVWYLRRSLENVVFAPRISLGLDCDKGVF